MATGTSQSHPDSQAIQDEINRLIEVGRILLTVLTPEELDQLKNYVLVQTGLLTVSQPTELHEIGNASVT